MLGQIGQLVGLVLGSEGGAFLLTDVLGVATTQLDPLGELLDSLRETMRWVGFLLAAKSLSLFLGLKIG